MTFNPENYETVAVRLDRWLKANPSGRVITELVHYLSDVAVFKAELWLDNVCVATGWAEEIRGSGGMANKSHHVENCETSAIGRALANAGVAGADPNNRPSREEITKEQRYNGNSNNASSQPKRQFEGTKIITNKMAGKCMNCGDEVPVGGGEALNDGTGWKTRHKEGQCSVEEPF